ncbi:hypothetical protein GW17_00019103 [Ensete ventricosum]|nr:hypothetical protein GW17_00019103 [Ensete ventricosum]RZR95711.1 hypothetical protein BHM03_00024584 [Ensete ventricosum]
MDFRKTFSWLLLSVVAEHGLFCAAQSLRSSIPNPPANFKLREDPLTGSSLKGKNNILMLEVCEMYTCTPRSFFSLSSFRSKESKPR